MSDVPEGFDDPDVPEAEPLPPEQPIVEPTQVPVEPGLPPLDDDPGDPSFPPQGDEERSGEGPAPDPEEDAEPSPKEFPEEHRRAFEGLMHIGRLSDTVDVYGHEIIIQTLTMEQMMVAGLIHKKYRETLGDTRAWQAAVLAGAIQSVDGQALPIPVEKVTTETLMRDRFAYITKHWFPPTIDVVYTAFLELEGQVEEVLRALGEASG